MAMTSGDEFPCKLSINIPFLTPKLASIALRALSVDKELSPLVQRSFSLTNQDTLTKKTESITSSNRFEEGEKTNLRVQYQATTNRMLRVSVNGFFESLKLVVQVMEDLDVDVVMGQKREDLIGVQGLGEVPVGV